MVELSAMSSRLQEAMEIVRHTGGETPSHLEREFSPENVRAYGQMCVEVALNLLERTEKVPDSTILLPSRGAVPIFLGAILAMREEGTVRDLSKDFLQQVVFPPFDCCKQLNGKVEHSKDKPQIEVLLFPFTADVNFHDEVLTTEIVGKMRRFCVNAVNAFYDEPEQRFGPEFTSFLRFLEVVEKRQDLADYYRRFPKVKNLILMDTVISGRASATILDEFSRLGRKPENILIIDANGQKLKREYEKVLLKPGVERIRVPRIFTEDRGAALEGVAAVVYPTLINPPENASIYGQFVSAGSWWDVLGRSKEQYNEAFTLLLDLITGGIKKEGDDVLRRKTRRFLDTLKRNRILSRDPKLDARDFTPFPPTKVEETSARVIQISFSPQVTQDLLRQILAK